TVFCLSCLLKSYSSREILKKSVVKITKGTIASTVVKLSVFEGVPLVYSKIGEHVIVEEQHNATEGFVELLDTATSTTTLFTHAAHSNGCSERNAMEYSRGKADRSIDRCVLELLIEFGLDSIQSGND
ncbi:hypothetical protein J6590_010965, partial [Homalodisca vitripennis]